LSSFSHQKTGLFCTNEKTGGIVAAAIFNATSWIHSLNWTKHHWRWRYEYRQTLKLSVRWIKACASKNFWR